LVFELRDAQFEQGPVGKTREGVARGSVDDALARGAGSASANA